LLDDHMMKRNMAQPLINLGISNALQRNLIGAFDAMSASISAFSPDALEPYLLQPWFNLAEISAAKGDDEDALAAADTALMIGIRGGMPDGYLVSAHVRLQRYLKTGDRADLETARLHAQSAVELAQAKEKSTFRPWYLLARTLLEYARVETDEGGKALALRNATECASKAVDLRDCQSDELQVRVLSYATSLVAAEIALEAGQLDRASELFADAESCHPDDALSACFAIQCEGRPRYFVTSEDNRYVWIDSMDALDAILQSVRLRLGETTDAAQLP